MNRLLSTRVLAVAAALVIAAGLAVALTGDGSVRATAYVTSATGIYPGDEVRILGVPVGLVDRIEPDGAQVRIDFHYDAEQPVPADARAAIVAPSLVSSRYLQLAPRYSGGPVLADGAVIPVARTAVPVEWDAIKDQIARLSTALGPDATDPEGSLARALDVGADTLAGQGAGLNSTLTELAGAATTLAGGSEDLFGTVRNLQVFTSALATSDEQVVEFGERLASVSGTLDDNREQLGTALADLRSTVATLQEFVADNRDGIDTSVERLGGVTGILAAQQDDLAQVLHAAPIPIVDLYNAYQPGSNSLHGQLAVANFQNPAQLVCSGIAAAGNMDPQQAAQECATTLGPVLELLTMNYPPVTADPLQRTGSAPTAATPREGPDRPSTVLPPATGPGGPAELLTPGGGR